jgi:hypothetical protein
MNHLASELTRIVGALWLMEVVEKVSGVALIPAL